MMTPQTIQFSPLSPKHEKRLAASGIDRRQIQDRGYRAVITKTELGRLGFGRDCEPSMSRRFGSAPYRLPRGQERSHD